MERRANTWFLYRNPTPSSVEIYAECEDRSKFGEWVDLDGSKEPKYFDHKPQWRIAIDDTQTKIAHRDEYIAMLTTVIMLAKWKKSHEEK